MGAEEEPAGQGMGRPVLVDIDRLRCHEEIQRDLLDRTRDEIRRDGRILKPILVAKGDLVILDGHHRYHALKELGCRRIPAYLVDYRSDAVDVDVWPEATVHAITKDEVIRRGIQAEPFPPKTSRHRVRIVLEDHPVDLADLM